MVTKFTVILPEPTGISAVTPVGYWSLYFLDSKQNLNLQPKWYPTISCMHLSDVSANLIIGHVLQLCMNAATGFM